MNKTLYKAAWIRAYRSFLQALVAQIPTGFVITPAMIQYFKVSYIFVILAIVANAVLYAFASFVTCIVGGLPEVNATEVLNKDLSELEEVYIGKVSDDEEEEDTDEDEVM